MHEVCLQHFWVGHYVFRAPRVGLQPNPVPKIVPNVMLVFTKITRKKLHVSRVKVEITKTKEHNLIVLFAPVVGLQPNPVPKIVPNVMLVFTKIMRNQLRVFRAPMGTSKMSNMPPIVLLALLVSILK